MMMKVGLGLRWIKVEERMDDFERNKRTNQGTNKLVPRPIGPT
jgi:hypothetical protein